MEGPWHEQINSWHSIKPLIRKLYNCLSKAFSCSLFGSITRSSSLLAGIYWVLTVCQFLCKLPDLNVIFHSALTVILRGPLPSCRIRNSALEMKSLLYSDPVRGQSLFGLHTSGGIKSIEGPWDTQLKAGTEAEATEEQGLLAWSPWLSQIAFWKHNSGPSSQRWYHSGLCLLAGSFIKNMDCRLSYRPFRWKHFLSEVSSFQTTL